MAPPDQPARPSASGRCRVSSGHNHTTQVVGEAFTPTQKILIIVDGPHKIKELDFNQIPVIDGDAKSLAIACASIFAKVIRDKWMNVLDLKYPGYGFSRHKGYGTKFHLKTLKDKGLTPVHRMSFKPVKVLCTALEN
jgi:ribonuclease HII